MADGEVKRGITVLKMRGSAHDKGIREFNIDQNGMHLGSRFRNVTGILAGSPVHVLPGELEEAWSKHDVKLDERRAAEGGRADHSNERRSGRERRK